MGGRHRHHPPSEKVIIVIGVVMAALGTCAAIIGVAAITPR